MHELICREWRPQLKDATFKVMFVDSYDKRNRRHSVLKPRSTFLFCLCTAAAVNPCLVTAPLIMRPEVFPTLKPL